MAHPAFQLLTYSDLPHWDDDTHLDAFRCFLVSAEKFRTDGKYPKTKLSGVDGKALSGIFQRALEDSRQIQSDAAAKGFFEKHFVPVSVPAPSEYPEEWPGLLTAYYEPVLEGSRSRSPEFSVPLLRRPSDLIEIKTDADRAKLPQHWPEGLRFGKSVDGKIKPYFDRSEIEGKSYSQGALAERGLELVWLQNRVEAFFVHIQGSACINLRDGTTLRVSYDGKSGHDYTPIGRVLKERGALASGNITMESIKAWLHANPDEQLNVLHANRSFIFFREETGLTDGLGPRAAAGVQLTTGRSLAVDRLMHSFHTPIYVSSKQDDQISHRLMIAQDTGSAIVGPHRGDYFAGSGTIAGAHAGGFCAAAHFTLLLPKTQLETLQ
ncbi:MAG: MltA domain-containing protein [Hyphomicrobiales bacterium]